MPEFVQTSATQELPTPFHFPGVKAWVFMFEISMGPVKRYCDTYLNLGDPRRRPFVYRPMPLYPYATMMVLEYPIMVSADRNPAVDPTFAARGFMSQKEVLIDFPVLRHGTRLDNFLSDVSLEFAVPFIVVDNATSAISGREIIGFQKIVGQIDIETIVGKSALGGALHETGFTTSVNLPGYDSAGSENELEHLVRFMDIKTGPPVPGVGASPNSGSIMTLFDTGLAAKTFEGAAGLYDLVNKLACGTLPNLQQMVALKQFRDPSSPKSAIYQAITTASPRYYNVRDIKYYNENDVYICLRDKGSLSDITKALFDRDSIHSKNVQWLDQGDGSNKIVIKPALACSFTSEIDYDEQSILYTYVSPDDPRGGRPTGNMISPWLKPWMGFWARR